MQYFKQIVKNTLVHLLYMVGDETDREAENEIDGALTDLEEYINKHISYAIEAHETENGHSEP